MLKEDTDNNNTCSSSNWAYHMKKIKSYLNDLSLAKPRNIKFTESKARNFAKNRWSVTKLKLDM